MAVSMRFAMVAMSIELVLGPARAYDVTSTSAGRGRSCFSSRAWGRPSGARRSGHSSAVPRWRF